MYIILRNNIKVDYFVKKVLKYVKFRVFWYFYDG